MKCLVLFSSSVLGSAVLEAQVEIRGGGFAFLQCSALERDVHGD